MPMRRWQTFSLFALTELVCTKKNILPYFIILYFLTPSFFPFKLSQTEKFQHPPLPKFFFFPLSVRGPTRRRNSTGLAELWGGWPIERDKRANYLQPKNYDNAATMRVVETMFSKIFGERNLTKTSKYYFEYYFLDNFVWNAPPLVVKAGSCGNGFPLTSAFLCLYSGKI